MQRSDDQKWTLIGQSDLLALEWGQVENSDVIMHQLNLLYQLYEVYQCTICTICTIMCTSNLSFLSKIIGKAVCVKI